MNHNSDVGSVTNLSGTSAVEKMRKIVQASRVCFFGTSQGKLPLAVRPMSVQEVDAVGNVWFLSGRSSAQNHHINRDPRVQLLFASPGDSEYLSLLGTASIGDSPELRKRYWNPLAAAWFQAGVDDPELTVIKVQVQGGHYWDTVHGKTVSLLELAVAAVTGQAMDGGVQGDVRPF